MENALKNTFNKYFIDCFQVFSIYLIIKGYKIFRNDGDGLKIVLANFEQRTFTLCPVFNKTFLFFNKKIRISILTMSNFYLWGLIVWMRQLLTSIVTVAPLIWLSDSLLHFSYFDIQRTEPLLTSRLIICVNRFLCVMPKWIFLKAFLFHRYECVCVSSCCKFSLRNIFFTRFKQRYFSLNVREGFTTFLPILWLYFIDKTKATKVLFFPSIVWS